MAQALQVPRGWRQSQFTRPQSELPTCRKQKSPSHVQIWTRGWRWRRRVIYWFTFPRWLAKAHSLQFLGTWQSYRIQITRSERADPGPDCEHRKRSWAPSHPVRHLRGLRRDVALVLYEGQPTQANGLQSYGNFEDYTLLFTIWIDVDHRCHAREKSHSYLRVWVNADWWRIAWSHHDTHKEDLRA